MKTILKFFLLQITIFTFNKISFSQSDYALNFDGVNDYVDIPDNDLLNFDASHPITVEFWVMRTSNTGGHIFGKRPGCNPTINYQSYSDENSCGLEGHKV